MSKKYLHKKMAGELLELKINGPVKRHFVDPDHNALSRRVDAYLL